MKSPFGLEATEATGNLPFASLGTSRTYFQGKRFPLKPKGGPPVERNGVSKSLLEIHRWVSCCSLF